MGRKNNILYWISVQVFDEMALSIREEKINHDINLCRELGITCYESGIEEIKIGKSGGESGSTRLRCTRLVTLGGCTKERIMKNLFKLKDS